MYENLLHQDAITHQLRRDKQCDTLPPALLFSGPAISGKLTAALETARILSCKKIGAWNCPCNLCGQHRLLINHRTLLTGTRYLWPEIVASADVLRREVSEAACYLFIRSVRKLIRRFDPILWEGNEKKISGALPIIENLSENIDNLLPVSDLPTGRKLEKLLDSLVDNCTAIQKFLPGGLPVSQVRHITSWAVHSVGTDHKTVIIDSADRMPLSARNALLKFLEEPPPNTTVILIAERKSLLLPTIVSRVRDYSFRARNSDEENDVLHRVFREYGNRYAGLNDYFQAWHTGHSEQMNRLADDFIEGVKSGYYPEEMVQIKNQNDLLAFLEALGNAIQVAWREKNDASPLMHKKVIEWLREAGYRAGSLNIPIPLVLRYLHISLGIVE